MSEIEIAPYLTVRGRWRIGSNRLMTKITQVLAVAASIVHMGIVSHGVAGGLERADGTLTTVGDMVVKHSEPCVVGNGFSMIERKGVHNKAEKMLKTGFGKPGQCFPLKGSAGFVQIKLRTAISPEAVTLEYAPKGLQIPLDGPVCMNLQNASYDGTSAPRDCRVYGWLQGMQGAQSLDVDNDKMLLTEFTHTLDDDKSTSVAQTFNVTGKASYAIVNMVMFEFTSNHGNPSHTCSYGVRVHGHQPTSLSCCALLSTHAYLLRIFPLACVPFNCKRKRRH